jgi:hypothetical protein
MGHSPDETTIITLPRRTRGDRAVYGVAILGEPATAARITAAALIIAGLVMMKLSSP